MYSPITNTDVDDDSFELHLCVSDSNFDIQKKGQFK